MKDIIEGIKSWNRVRNDHDVLEKLFADLSGFELDMRLFPEKEPIHAYAAIKNKELYFLLISEKNDVRQSETTLQQKCIWVKCENKLGESQEITEGDAKERIQIWKNIKKQWINETIKQDKELYQNFYIPTTDLKPEIYSVFFALKSNEAKNIKVADLVLKNNVNVFFDTVLDEPPYRVRRNYYILDLI